MTRGAIRHAAGMTMIEVMIAVTLLGIVMAGLMFSFRTAMKTFETGIRHGEGTVEARAAINLLLDDLRNVHYLPENRYNTTYRQRQTIVEQRQQQAAAAGREYDPLADPDAPDPGSAIDLSFRVEDGGPADRITFVRNQGDRITDDRLLYGLSRVTWSLSGGALTRSTEDVTMPGTDADGNELEKPVAPSSDPISKNVVSFDLRMGYWFEGDWQLANDWNSKENVYRNPVDEKDMAAVSEQMASAQGTGLDIQAQLAQRGLQFIPDNLPSWVEITIVFRDPADPARTRTYRNVAQFPMAQETYFDQELLRGAASGMNRGGPRRRINP